MTHSRYASFQFVHYCSCCVQALILQHPNFCYLGHSKTIHDRIRVSAKSIASTQDRTLNIILYTNSNHLAHPQYTSSQFSCMAVLSQQKRFTSSSTSHDSLPQTKSKMKTLSWTSNHPQPYKRKTRNKISNTWSSILAPSRYISF